MKVPEDPRSILEEVIFRLPPLPKTTEGFLSYHAASDSCKTDSGSVVSGGAISSAASGRILSCDVSTDAVPAAAASCTPDVVVGSVISGGGVSELDIVSGSVRVQSDAGPVASCISGLGNLSAGVSSDGSDSLSSGCILSGEVQGTNRVWVLPDRAVQLILRLLPIKDVFRLGFLLSRRWRQIWQEIPLTIHDQQFVPDSIMKEKKEGEGINVNVAHRLSAVLDQHPGDGRLLGQDGVHWSLEKLGLLSMEGKVGMMGATIVVDTMGYSALLICDWAVFPMPDCVNCCLSFTCPVYLWLMCGYLYCGNVCNPRYWRIEGDLK